MVKNNLITTETQLIAPEPPVVFMGRHKPIPGTLAAAVRAVTPRENNMAVLAFERFVLSFGGNQEKQFSCN